MIEVEKKFALTEEQRENLLRGADFLGKSIFTDEYYDNDVFALTTKDVWLRARDGQWEMQIPHDAGDRWEDNYEKIQDEAVIRKYLELEEDGKSLEEALISNGYSPFCVCGTSRAKYQKDDFVIDIDSVEYGDLFRYFVRMELLVEDRAEIPAALSKIQTFANSEGLRESSARAKVLDYIQARRPDHYQALVAAGVVKE